MSEGMRFCSSCGQDSQAAVQALEAKPQIMHNQQHGIPLVSGNGKLQSIIGLVVHGIGLIVDIVLLVYGIDNMHTYNFRGEAWPVLLVITGVAGLIYSLYQLAIDGLRYNSSISVYSATAKGHGQTNKLSLPQEFSVPIGEIKNVDTIKAQLNKNNVLGVVVYTQYAKYICYMQNGNEVRDKIMELVDAQKANMT